MDRPRAEWIIVYDATRGDLAYAAHCLRCNTVQRPPPLPVPLRILTAVWDAFSDQHIHCAPKQEPPHA